MTDNAVPGFLSLLRQLERAAPDRPRIGRAERTRDEIADLGQDPFLTFPDSDLSEAALDQTPPRVRPRVLGFYGPHGALPLTLTEEVLGWGVLPLAGGAVEAMAVTPNADGSSDEVMLIV